MADPKEDKIDFLKLERELEAAVESDAHYWRENDAKMRAVEQRVETYEQFKDMVSAAHIKPLEKDDKMGMMRSRNQPWNPYCSKTKDGNQQSNADLNKKKDSPVLPTNSNDFTKQWRKLKEDSVKYIYLIDIGGDRLVQIFHAEISFGLLGDILAVLNQNLQTSDSKTVMHILVSLSETNRFSLSVDFLSNTEKTYCSELMSKLENCTTSVCEKVENDVDSDVHDQTDNERLKDVGVEVNGNSSNSKAESEEEKGQDAPDKKGEVTTMHGGDNKEILDRLKSIYKILPLGR